MTEKELGELRSLWDEATIEVSMSAIRELTDENGYRLFDVEYQHVATVYGTRFSKGEEEHKEALANAKLIAWLLDHSWRWAEEGR